MIKVATQGGEVKEIKYTEGMRVNDAIKAAGVKANKKATITVNGKDAKAQNPVKDGDTVVVTPKVSNG